MLSLYGHDDYAVLGVAAALGIEAIPHRRIDDLGAHDQSLLVACGRDFSPDECAAFAGTRTLVLDGGIDFARRAAGVVAPIQDECGLALPLSEPMFPPGLFQRAGCFGMPTLQLPLAPLCRVADPSALRVHSWLVDSADGASLPAVVRLGDCLWCTVDLGSAFAHLLTERYAPAAGGPGVVSAWARGLGEALYYVAPARLQAAAQRAAYATLSRRLERGGPRTSRYPIDPTGWLLIELLSALVHRAAGFLVRLARWPAGYHAAAAVTHDVEPSRYAYRSGLPRLVAGLDERERAAFGLVAGSARRHLGASTSAALVRSTVYCHGLRHRGEPSRGRARLARRLRAARTSLEAGLARPVRGYRSPRLDRSPDLAWALDACGFSYDSSYPDVDRENVAHYGAGVRVNVPYRPPLQDPGGGWRASRCLELPLTAPDCIQPVLAGEPLDALRAAVEQKAAFVESTGGLYVALVHAGVFGPEDAARRETHLAFVRAQLARPGMWLADLEEIVDWWLGREALHVSTEGRVVSVENRGTAPLAGAVLIVERGADHRALPLVALEPAAQVRLDALAPASADREAACLPG